MTDEPGDSDLRRRAAWLLAMLALVAVLFVVVLTTLLNSDGDKGSAQGGPDDSLSPIAPTSTSKATATTSPPSATTSSRHGPASCPTKSVCALDDDIGNAVDAINDFRKRNDQQAVPGSVSAAAKRCALGDGDNCSGGFAESQVAKPTGDAAVAKIKSRGKLLDPDMKSFEVGWAYDPRAKQYFFAIIRND